MSEVVYAVEERGWIPKVSARAINSSSSWASTQPSP